MIACLGGMIKRSKTTIPVYRRGAQAELVVQFHCDQKLDHGPLNSKARSTSGAGRSRGALNTSGLFEPHHSGPSERPLLRT